MRGLTKAFELTTGIEGNYWATTGAHVHCESNKIELRLELFYNKSAYDDGKDPLGHPMNIALDLPQAICDEIDKLLPAVKAQKEQSRDHEIEELVPGFFANAKIDRPEVAKPVTPTRKP